MNPSTPDKLPLSNLDFGRLLGLVGQANAELARYDGLLQGTVNPSLMLSPLMRQEAVLSSKIEGTQATAHEVLEQEAGLLKEGQKYQDILEIINYRTAMSQAQECLVDRPITLHFIRSLHRTLLRSVRGMEKSPGEFRKTQNWIGPEYCDIEHATFVPPSPITLQDHLDALERYFNYDDIDALLQTAVVHAQFELIHPFEDGNGRIGRILIPLFLFQKKKLAKPMFYLSEYLEKNRDLYYAKLRAISQHADWNGWIEFFLQAIIEQARENSYVVQQILSLYDQMKQQIQDLTRSQYIVQILDAIFDCPIFQTSDFVTRTGINKSTAMGVLNKLKSANLIHEIQPGSGRRSAVLCFDKLLNITENRNIFNDA